MRRIRLAVILLIGLAVAAAPATTAYAATTVFHNNNVSYSMEARHGCGQQVTIAPRAKKSMTTGCGNSARILIPHGFKMEKDGSFFASACISSSYFKDVKSQISEADFFLFRC